ncbi:MAG: ABC transporter substrate-binding protein [Chloroflexota bacterium]
MLRSSRGPRTAWSFVLVFATALAAACGTAAPSSAPPPTSAPGAAPTPPPTSPAAATQLPAGGATGAIKVGVLESLTGPLANQGKDNEDGFNLYLSSINNTVAGRQIEPIFVDDQGQPDVGLTKARQLVEGQGAQVIMGITPTAMCYAVAPYVKQVQVPLVVSANCGAEDLLTSEKYKSPFVVRSTQNATEIIDPAADWAYSAGFRKAVLVMTDLAPGYQNGDLFASAFIARGGAVVQELFPAQGTSDYAPYLSQLDSSADIVAVFLPGVDDLRFGQQFDDYVSPGHRPQILDLFGQMTTGPNLAQLGDKALGVVGEYSYVTALDNPENKTFLQQMAAAYPNRPVSTDQAVGYSGAQILVAALNKVNGQIESRDAFLQALYETSLNTPRGPVKLDETHDVIQNIYIYQIVKDGSSVVPRILATYPTVSRVWDRSQAQIDAFPFGTLRGTWESKSKNDFVNTVTLPTSTQPTVVATPAPRQ